MPDEFRVVLLRGNDIEVLSTNMSTSISDVAPAFKGAFVPGRCDNCGTRQILEAEEFERVTGRTGLTGNPHERFYETNHFGECRECEEYLEAGVDYREFPPHRLQPYYLRQHEAYRYENIQGLGRLANSISTTVSKTEYNLYGRLWELQQSVPVEDRASGRIGRLEDELDRLLSFIEDTVTVLGSYGGATESELEALRDSLRDHGYDANIVDDLPQDSEMTLPQNVLMDMLLSRFCVMVDREGEASGHIREFEIAQNEAIILAHLVPEEGPSSFMTIDTEEYQFMRTFEFTDNPIEIIEPVIEWAEQTVEDRRELNLENYPWYESEES